ncbi:MAG: heparinase II/III family protein, partial [Pseudomonadota bacterium]
EDLADIIADLLSLAKSCIALNRPVPPCVVHTLDRVIPRLRSFVHRDGELATYAGASGGKAALVAALLNSDETVARPTSQAPQSGFVSLNEGVSTLLADVGETAGYQADSGYQSLSSVELSHDGERIFINVGMAPANGVKFSDIAQGAAAHNRLVLTNDGSEIVDLGQVQLKRWPDLAKGEDGYVLQYEVGLAAKTISMTRGLRLSADGRTLDGFDRVPKSVSVESAAIYFHMPTKSDASRSADGSIIVHTKGGQRWRVSSDSGSLDVQPSLQLAHPAGPQNTMCVRIDFDLIKSPTVAWRWARQA